MLETSKLYRMFLYKLIKENRLPNSLFGDYRTPTAKNSKGLCVKRNLSLGEIMVNVIRRFSNYGWYNKLLSCENSVISLFFILTGHILACKRLLIKSTRFEKLNPAELSSQYN